VDHRRIDRSDSTRRRSHGVGAIVWTRPAPDPPLEGADQRSSLAASSSAPGFSLIGGEGFGRSIGVIAAGFGALESLLSVRSARCFVRGASALWIERLAESCSLPRRGYHPLSRAATAHKPPVGRPTSAALGELSVPWLTRCASGYWTAIFVRSRVTASWPEKLGVSASGLTRLDEAGLPKLHQRAAAAERIKQRCASEPITAFAAKQGSSIGRPKTCSVGSAGGFRGRWSVADLLLRQCGRGEDRRDAFFSFRTSTEIGVRALLEFESPVSLGGRRQSSMLSPGHFAASLGPGGAARSGGRSYRSRTSRRARLRARRVAARRSSSRLLW